ncbi:hypothetical protein BS50DRAFT_488949 [Corynespora cassiicola Philippines]|uniref:NAD(P)-binding protein n=1 Tax=Corynespora cassiicola Philippines TaxID=1448308 RepID=A0A2T2NWK9_CORCC|nr:hypothetical protein BS50DRAFT_488949 [Corynespora cassiicola Philippines]
MVLLSEVRAHNAALKSLPPGLVAVFVGGTSGIGLYTAREFVRTANAPHIYLVGRNQNEASRIISEFRDINSSSRVDFIKASDASLLRNVDQVCKEIKEKEQKVNLLFMTVGYATFKGREETEEGLDKKFSLHYYARMRFIQNLAPLLAAAGEGADKNANLSRVVSVLDPKLARNTAPNFADLDLKNNFTLTNCATHASAMNNFAIEHFAKAYPHTSFIHAYPSGVESGAARDMGGSIGRAAYKVLTKLMAPLMVSPQESGERHLFASTASRYAPKARASEVKDAAQSPDGEIGGGAYQLNWNGEAFGNTQKLTEMRKDGAEQKIWSHTEEVFKKICDEGGKY